MFIRVDLPAPFSPNRQWISPGSTVRSMAEFAATDPNVLVMPRSSSRIARRFSKGVLLQGCHFGWDGDLILMVPLVICPFSAVISACRSAGIEEPSCWP